MTSRLGLVLCCLALVGGGCGGGDEEPSGNQPAAPGTATESAPTREQFIASGDEICKRVNDKVASFNQRIDDIERKATDEQQALAGVAPVVADAYDLQRDHLREELEEDQGQDDDRRQRAERLDSGLPALRP